MENSSIYLCGSILRAFVRNQSVCVPKREQKMDAAAFDGGYASYGSVLRMADVSLLSGRAAYELLSGQSAVKNSGISMSFPKRKGCIER